eukprot:CAMPEP_0172424056 /NCGR_PEP_ID=MMETSP1064-20121228/20860_1 /TAXON_ID=202472 /ORGANISM="Aulacoseira subarctica , Strain CCAP 1002/5" /LENGTH=346 /DNA_ID=CAMNT_0013165795 /DNA_START=112 /DNA_END=1152 /DNA_ORIENTATION=+
MPSVYSTPANNDSDDGIYPYDPLLPKEDQQENGNDEASVEFLGESGNSLLDYPHHRFLCIEFPIGKDPDKHCCNCFCVLCDARAADGCTNWNVHCSTSKQDYEVLVRSRAPQQQPYQQHPQHQLYQRPAQPQRATSQTSQQSQPMSRPQIVTPSSGLNGNWRNDEHDMLYRRRVIQNIAHIFKKTKNATNPEWLLKLPQLVKHLEVRLYMSAPSFDIYRDVKTLRSRLVQLVLNDRKNWQPQSVAPSSGLNGNWRDDEHDMLYRRRVIHHIVHFLKTNKNASDPEWLSKLPQLVKHLEVGLYMSAPSFNFYRDVKTLKSRLEQLTRKFKLWKWAQDRRKRNGWISK